VNWTNFKISIIIEFSIPWFSHWETYCKHSLRFNRTQCIIKTFTICWIFKYQSTFLIFFQAKDNIVYLDFCLSCPKIRWPF
jgi:hypothetical protein